MRISIYLVIFLMNCGYISSNLIKFNNLPKPDGPFDVGSMKFYWVDESRKEWYLDSYLDKRKLMVQIWYPALQPVDQKSMFYIERMDERLKYISNELEVPEYLLKNIVDIKSNSYKDALSIEGRFPVILFSHGLGGMRTQNSIQFEALASHGYIVVSTDHMYDSNIALYPDQNFAINLSHTDSLDGSDWYEIRNKQIDYRVGDISFLIDKLYEINNGDIKTTLQQKINLDKIGIFGHSFGGATSILSTIRDNRIDACLTYDAWFVPIEENVLSKYFDKPFLHVGQIKWENELNYQKLDLFLNHCDNDSYKLAIQDSKHFDFTDIPHFSSLTEKLNISGKINKNDLMMILNDLTIDFFNKYLKNIDLFEPQMIAKKYEKLISL